MFAMKNRTKSPVFYGHLIPPIPSGEEILHLLFGEVVGG